MTDKPNGRKGTRRKPSDGQLKQQLGAERSENDALRAEVEELRRRLEGREPESLVVAGVDMDQDPPADDGDEEDYQDKVSFAGVRDEMPGEKPAIPEKKSSYTYDELMELAAQHQRRKANSNIHVKNHQHAIEASEMYRGDESAVEGGQDQYDNVKLIKVAKDFDPKNPAMVEKHANELFMRDKLLVKILDTHEKNADPRFFVSVNGQSVVFVRGQQKWVPRYIVEGLARAKPIAYGNEEYTTQEGIRAVRHPKQIGLRYPFTVLSDPHPRGADWLAHVIAQP